jgi:ferric-dicitrate binding protein FerR (iron transport regulator)
MRASEESGARIRAEAAAFVARRHSGVARGEDERALDAWRIEDPAHEAAYAEAEALWQSLGSLDALASRQLAEARAYGARVTRRRELLSLVRSTARPWMRRAQ